MLRPWKYRAKSICRKESHRLFPLFVSGAGPSQKNTWTDCGAGNIALQDLQEAVKKNGVGVLPPHNHDFHGPCLSQVLLVFGTLLQADISRQIGTNPRI
jgi:hypothetical protein